jgi:hypothetical protein
MTTAIAAKMKDGGVKNLKFITEQYITGLYVAIYECDEDWNTLGTPSQGATQRKEKTYHKSLRKTAGDDFIEKESTPL